MHLHFVPKISCCAECTSSWEFILLKCKIKKTSFIPCTHLLRNRDERGCLPRYHPNLLHASQRITSVGLQIFETFDTITCVLPVFPTSKVLQSFVQENSSEVTSKIEIMAKVPANPSLSVHKSSISSSSSQLKSIIILNIITIKTKCQHLI